MLRKKSFVKSFVDTLPKVPKLFKSQFIQKTSENLTKVFTIIVYVAINYSKKLCNLDLRCQFFKTFFSALTKIISMVCLSQFF
jgi:hypothetical protein